MYLDPELSTPAGIAVMAAASTTTVTEPMQRTALMFEQAVELSVRDWTFVEANGDGTNHAIPVNPQTVRQHLPWMRGGAVVVTKAWELYGEAVGLPFVKPAKIKTAIKEISDSSPTGSTASSLTSAKPSTRSKRRTRSAPSSPANTEPA